MMRLKCVLLITIGVWILGKYRDSVTCSASLAGWQSFLITSEFDSQNLATLCTVPRRPRLSIIIR